MNGMPTENPSVSNAENSDTSRRTADLIPNLIKDSRATIVARKDIFPETAELHVRPITPRSELSTMKTKPKKDQTAARIFKEVRSKHELAYLCT